MRSAGRRHRSPSRSSGGPSGNPVVPPPRSLRADRPAALRLHRRCDGRLPVRIRAAWLHHQCHRVPDRTGSHTRKPPLAARFHSVALLHRGSIPAIRAGPHDRAAKRTAPLLMELINSLLGGFATALTPANLLYAGIGVLLGTAIGVLPGIGPALTISLLLPLTFKLDPVGAFIMFGGIYYGAMYGGSATSILVNAPGESASVVTAIDGYEMAKRGRAGAALATSATGAVDAGTPA